MKRVNMEGTVLTDVTASEMNFLGKRINFVNTACASPQLIMLYMSGTLIYSIH